MDDHYHGAKGFMVNESEEGNILHWDQALDLDLFKQHLIQLKEGQPIKKPIYNMKISEAIGIKKIIPQPVIITEGLFALHEKH